MNPPQCAPISVKQTRMFGMWCGEKFTLALWVIYVGAARHTYPNMCLLEKHKKYASLCHCGLNETVNSE